MLLGDRHGCAPLICVGVIIERISPQQERPNGRYFGGLTEMVAVSAESARSAASASVRTSSRLHPNGTGRPTRSSGSSSQTNVTIDRLRTRSWASAAMVTDRLDMRCLHVRWDGYPLSHTASAPSSGQPMARPALFAACAPGAFASQFPAMMRLPG